MPKTLHPICCVNADIHEPPGDAGGAAEVAGEATALVNGRIALLRVSILPRVNLLCRRWRS